MRIQTANGYTLSLTILGYQFPGLAHAPYDSNWLLISLEAATPEGRWQATDPCLLTYEAQALASWLREASAGTPRENQLEFTEPTLRFELETSPVTVLAVHFAYGFEPPWLQGGARPRNESITLRFPVSSSNLAKAADDLEAQLVRFPQRALH